MAELTFARFRKQNVMRCVNDFEHPLSAWSLAEWGNATGGECGEAQNIAKKILRIDCGLKRLTRESFVSKEQHLERLADEIADLVCYADLWAAAADIDLAKAVISKFNQVSDEFKSKVRL